MKLMALLYRLALIVVLAAGLVQACSQARAVEASAPIQGSPGPAAAGAPPAAGPSVVASCDKPSSPRMPDNGPISVSVNAATAWQPRAGQVLVAVTAEPAKLAGLYYKACFSWNTTQAETYFAAQNLASAQWFEGFVTVRPTDQIGVLNLGVIVPPIKAAPSGLLDRWSLDVRSTGLGLVPVADMRLIAYTNEGILFDEVRPIGITNVPLALLIAATTLLVAVGCLHQLATDPPSGTPRPRTISGALKFVASGDWILHLVRGSDGRASLSALQILLWTLIVAASAAYVMALSGNLINITPGTLTLLGIAGGAGLIAAVADAPAKLVDSTNTGSSVPVAATKVVVKADLPDPQWRDLIFNCDRLPDISRIQLLFFTVVSSAFVVMQVLNYFVIPDIPAGYQILMGISNGVYVGRKCAVPKQPSS